MRVGTYLVAPAVAALLFAIGGGAAADEAAVKYREAVMEAVGGHTKALGAIVKGEVAHVGDLKAHVAALDALATMSQHIFPTAPESEKSELLPAAWEKPQEFKQALVAYETAAGRPAPRASRRRSASSPRPARAATIRSRRRTKGRRQSLTVGGRAQ